MYPLCSSPWIMWGNSLSCSWRETLWNTNDLGYSEQGMRVKEIISQNASCMVQSHKQSFPWAVPLTAPRSAPCSSLNGHQLVRSQHVSRLPALILPVSSKTCLLTCAKGQWRSVGCQCQWILQVFLKFTRICGDFWRGPGHVCSRAIALYIRSGPVTTSTWNLATAPTLDILGHSSLLKTGKNCQEMTTNVLKKSTCLLNFWLVSVFKMHRNEIRCPQLPDTKGNHFSHRSAIGTCYSTVKEFCHSTMFFLHHGSSK